jgi:glycosyltransferase involved in cell wall biosynthesis/Tfp pilus assembly protein PilF/SAM-dependent methyltransferase
VQYGHALKESGHVLEAESAYRKSMVLGPEIADTHLQLGHALKMQGKRNEAAVSYFRALALEPTLPHATDELVALGWPLFAMDETARGSALRAVRYLNTWNDEAEADKIDSSCSIVFDVSDLITYFLSSRVPSGIQRVQINVITSVLRQRGANYNPVVACHTLHADYWIRVPNALFLELADLAVATERGDDAIWRAALSELHLILTVGKALEFEQNAILVNLGSSWGLPEYFLMIRAAKAKFGIRYIPFVHDCIPMIMPEDCDQKTVRDYINWLVGVFFHADGYLTNSHSTAADLTKFARLLGHKIAAPRVVRLDGCFTAGTSDSNPARVHDGVVTRHELDRKDFVLFVSTLEARKNHAMAFASWLALIKKRGLRRTPMLVCVGRLDPTGKGAVERLQASELLGRKVLLLSEIPDDDLAELYRRCLFTLYPSRYEGWGLPITEALSYGKVPLTTTVSSLTEAGGDLAEYFDLRSIRDLIEKLERLIDDNEYRRVKESKIRECFRSRSWADIGAEIVETVLADRDPVGGAADHKRIESPKVWPMPAETGRYYGITRNNETSLWPGKVVGEMYRTGSGWWNTEEWGTWTRRTSADLVFSLVDPSACSHVVYLGLRAPPNNTKYRVEIVESGTGVSGRLAAGEDRWIMLEISPSAEPKAAIHLRITAGGLCKFREATDGGISRAVGLGVLGFYMCRKDDVLARDRFDEALRLKALDQLLRPWASGPMTMFGNKRRGVGTIAGGSAPAAVGHVRGGGHRRRSRFLQTLLPRAAAGSSILRLTIPGVRKTPRSLGDRARDVRDWARAVRHYQAALKQDPGDFPIWVQYGHALKESGQVKEAESAYRKSIELACDIADTHLQLGHVLKMQGRKEEAASAYLRAVVLDPALHRALVELLGLGWTISSIKDWITGSVQRSLRLEQTRCEKERNDLNSSLTTIVFDVSDLIDYFSTSRLPTGVQRVQINVISSLIHKRRRDFNLVVACYTPRTDFWASVPQPLFLELADLALSGGDADDPAWRALLSELDLLLSGTRPLEFARGTTLVNIGTSWWLPNYFLMMRYAKSKYGIRYVPFVHDCIPIVVPEIVPKEQTQEFLRWLVGVFFHADAFLVNSKASAADLVKYAERLGHHISEPDVIRLDGRFSDEAKNEERVQRQMADTIIERHGLQAEDFVLFVGTIELRKNHLLTFDAWLELIRKRGLQKTPLLVCVGKVGWGADTPKARLNASELLKQRVLLLSNVADDDLAELYRRCLFTLFPSSYEGWGLPVSEALSYGKVPLTTTESSLPEVGGELAEYFDLQSERELLEKLERLIDDVDYRESREKNIRERFKPRDWADIGDEIVASVLAANHAPTAAISRGPNTDNGIWALPAETGRYYGISSNSETNARPGLVCGEMYRIGNSWWNPEHWGTWVKRGQAEIAFSLDSPCNITFVLYLGLRGIPRNWADYRVWVAGSDVEETGSLAPDEDRWVVLKIPSELIQGGMIHVKLAANREIDLREVTNGGDPRVITLGVIGFFVSPEDDMIARHQFVEAMQLRGLHNLNGRPAEAEEHMTRPLLQYQSADGRGGRNQVDKNVLSKKQAFEIVYGHPPAAEIEVSTGNFEIRPEEIVFSFYHSILGRSPDEAGLLHHTRRIREGTPLTEVVGDFLNSAESKPRGVVSLGDLDALPANVIDLDLSPAKRQLLWDHLGTVWSRLGREDPYWSVLASEDFRIAKMSRADQIDRFYESGRFDIERLVKYLSRNGRRLPEHGTCVDFGCGLGRTTLWLARRCKRVLGVDVSENHINIARESLAARGVTNVDFRLVRTRKDLDVLRGIDFFHSIIVLQHSPPPLIADILSTVFDGLNPDGSAFFQVPTYAIDYRWQYEEYVAETVPKQRMEMHVLPQSVIFDLAAKAGCVPLEVQPDHCTGLAHWISNTCVFAKPGPPRGAGNDSP